MQYNTAPVCMVINKNIWRKIGSMSKLVAYSKIPVFMLGQANVKVSLVNKTMILAVAVTKKKFDPLFGVDWMKAFSVRHHEIHILGLIFKSGLLTHRLQSVVKSLDSLLELIINEAIKQILSSHVEVPDGKLGKVKSHQAVVYLHDGVQLIIYRAHPVELALRNAVEVELN